MDLEASINRIAQMAGQQHKPEIVKVPHEESGKELTILIKRDGGGGMVNMDLTDFLCAWDANPLFRAGTARFETLDSFIAHAIRFKDGNSAMFATKIGGDISIQCVIDYHSAVNYGDGKVDLDALPRFGRHRGKHDFPLSEEFKKWRKVSDSSNMMETEDFSFFLEDNIVDVMYLPPFLRKGGEEPKDQADRELWELIQKLEGKPCGPDTLMNLAKGLQVNEDTKIEAFFDRNSGQAKIAFKTEHKDASGQVLDVPNMFLISIPVFNGDQPYRIPVRLRYRPRAGTVLWKMEMHRPDIYLEDAFTLACEKAAAETSMPLFYGQPE